MAASSIAPGGTPSLFHAATREWARANAGKFIKLPPEIALNPLGLGFAMMQAQQRGPGRGAAPGASRGVHQRRAVRLSSPR